MADYSISCKKVEQKTDFTEGTNAPTAGEAIEIRVDEAKFTDKLDFWGTLERLLQRMRERAEPRF